MKREFHFRPIEGVLALSVLVMSFTACSAVKSATKTGQSYDGIYPATCVVTGKCDVHESVTVKTQNGNVYEFCGNGFEVGEVLSVLMDSNGTAQNVTDDIILDVWRAGTANDYLI